MGEEVTITNQKQIPAGGTLHSVFEMQISELAEIRHPSLSHQELESKIVELRETLPPVYVWFPWRKQLLETVPENEFLEIKTNRNKLLITASEQEKLYWNTSVSIAGMSVGSSILFGCVGAGIAKEIVIADNDVFSNSNLNRVSATVFDIGASKVWTAYRRAMEMNPFIKIKVMEARLTPESLPEFFNHDATSVVFDEVDDFRMKVTLRDYARHTKKPLVMLTNLGSSVQIDVERYDTDNNYLPFHGLVSEDMLESIRQMPNVDREMMKKLSVALVDSDLIPERAVQSLQEIGKTLVGRPQLYSTVALDGGIAPEVIKHIVLQESFQSGRYAVKLNDSMV